MTDTATVDREIGQLKEPPDGLRLRAYAGEQDIPFIVEATNREFEYEQMPFRVSLGDMKARYSRPSLRFDARRDVTIAEVDGEPVGYGARSWVDTAIENFRDYFNEGAVLPEWRRRGIGTALLAENISRQRALAATHETDRPRILGAWSSARMTGAQALMRSFGFAEVRWFFEMTRDLSQPIPDVAMPTGLEVRDITPELVRQVWDADVEAFQDHWGGFDSSEENFHRWMDEPSFDPSLWVIAFDGDEVAGGVVNGIEADENEMLGLERGWLHSVFTRRAWRKRGLANALIARSMVKIRDRGMDTAILGVDADNPTGALGLYERNGFVVAERSTAWRKPLDLEI